MSSGARVFLLQIVALLLAILFGALIGSAILLAIHKNPLEVYGLMVRFNLTRADSIGSILYKSTPLILAGLAPALSFRVNLFNIGVEGQYYIGAIAAAYVGFAVTGLPRAIHLPLVLLVGVAGGMLWALLPIVLKLRRGAHEVITTIMMNAIAGAPVLRTPSLLPLIHLLGLRVPESSRLNWLLLIGVALCVLFWWILGRWRFGYEVRAVAQNPDAAEAAGIGNQRIMFLMFILSGGGGGPGGVSDVLGGFGSSDLDFPKGYGFLGISIALLAKNNPIGVIVAALFFAFLDRGAQGIQVFAGAPREGITLLPGLVILAPRA